MKKSVLAAVLAASLFLSGCSGVSQEEYNSSPDTKEILDNITPPDNTDVTKEDKEKETHDSKESDTRNVDDYDIFASPETSSSTPTTETEQTTTIDYKKDIFTVGTSQLETTAENIWYYTEDGGISAVTYIDSYNGLDDIAIVTNAYLDMYDIILDLPYKDIYFYTWAKEDGTIVGSAFRISISGVGSTSMPIVWIGEFAYLNDSAVSDLYSELWTSSEAPPTISTPATEKSTTAPQTQTTHPAQATATTGEINALKTAQSYLKYSAFSRNGLIEQLEYEGYTNSEAVYGADNVGADWNEQALKKAHSYLNYSSFSYKGLIEQLEYVGFTHEQAVYGADNCGLEGDSQALEKAKSYLSIMAFSYSGLIEQLEFEGFSHEDAVKAADNCGADWNEQAAKKAKSYLDMMSFSRASLIEQLEYEGFTHEQAVYGATANGY